MAALALGLVIACEGERAPEKGVAATTQQAMPAAAPTVTPERPMALRREAQGLLDSARVALIRGDASSAATLWQHGAAFLVTQARTPPNRGTNDLLAAARGLDSLASDVRQRRTVDSSRADQLSAHVNLAEAERHVALASVAWSTRSKESVSDELTMAADHIQRAARDGRIMLSPAMRRTLVKLNALARDLAAQPELDIRELDEPLGTLHIEIAAMHGRVRRTPDGL
ncbi:MAG: hypothetical protein H7247_11705 [Polaromonas sp.]|nr:hypothetical protein [Gemmatimonadaceae bacterium]